MSDDIQAVSADYTGFMDLSRLPRTLIGGTAAMRKAGVDYLPQGRFETTTNYNARVDRSFLFNAYRQTVSFLAGQVFQKKIEFNGEEADSTAIQEYTADIDHKGNDLNVFAKRVFFNGLAVGCSHILVEMPNEAPATTRQEEKDLGIRPYLKEVKPEDCIGWVDEDGILLQVRIKGSKKEREGRYGVKVVNTILVLEPGTWELFEADGKGNFGKVPAESGTTNLSYIPFVTFIPGEELSVMTGKTPLDDLTWLSLKHWQSSSDQNNILHVGRVPILFGKNLEAKALEVGTAKMINSNDEHGDLRFVEITGAAIGAGRQDLEDTKTEMALWGLQQLIPRTGNMTATEKSLSSSESNSSLSTWAVEFEDVLNAAFSIMGDFMGSPLEGKITAINKDYFVGLDTGLLDIILKSVDMGISSRKMAFDELKRRGVYDNDYTWDDVKDEIEEDKRNSSTFTDLAGGLLGGAE